MCPKWLEELFQGNDGGHALLVKHKAKLLKQAHGRVVEIGPGVGENFSYYPKDISWAGVEPNHKLHSELYRRAKDAGINHVSLRSARGEALPFCDASADAVVATHLLCSVQSPFRVLSEVLRVLKPDGKFFFFEHVAAPRQTRTWWVQKLAKPIWTLAGSGCRPDLDTALVIREANFRSVHIEPFTVDRPIAGPHIAGIAIK